jgi:hypothetical protein
MNASISFSRGVTTVQRSSTSRSGRPPSFEMRSSSSFSVRGSSATPGPIKSFFFFSSPEGSRWKTKVRPPMTIVCPALLPPLYLTTASNLSA